MNIWKIFEGESSHTMTKSFNFSSEGIVKKNYFCITSVNNIFNDMKSILGSEI